MTQSCAEISWLSGAVADAAHGGTSGCNSEVANDAGNASKSACGDKGIQLVGRSRVIHMLWNGFLFVGVELSETPRLGWLMD